MNQLVPEWRSNPRKIHCGVYIGDKNVIEFGVGRCGICILQNI